MDKRLSKAIREGIKQNRLSPTKIKVLREAKNITQIEAASLLKVSYSWFTRFEAGRLSADRFVAMRIAELLGSSQKNLFKKNDLGRFIAVRGKLHE